jgi:hypothetical protein
MIRSAEIAIERKNPIDGAPFPLLPFFVHIASLNSSQIVSHRPSRPFKQLTLKFVAPFIALTRLPTARILR